MSANAAINGWAHLTLNLEAVTMAKENGVILFTLVPHTTHEM